MTKNSIGTKFEKFIQSLMQENGIKTTHNVLFKRGKRRCQADLLEEHGIFFRHRTIYECKFVSPSSSTQFNRYFIQLAEAMLFTGSDGVLVTNGHIPKKQQRSLEYHIEIFDRTDLHRLGAPVDIEQAIRQVPYSPHNHKYVVRNL